jgi:hypothetical protein
LRSFLAHNVRYATSLFGGKKPSVVLFSVPVTSRAFTPPASVINPAAVVKSSAVFAEIFLIPSAVLLTPFHCA